jgi:uroporphyrinogen decarboxylase
MSFEPDYTHIVDAALNRPTRRLPLYEHGFAPNVVEAILEQEVSSLLEGDLNDKTEGYRRICRFAAQHGYDAIPFECLTTNLVQGAAGLMGHADPLLNSLEDVNAYPWDTLPDRYMERFRSDFDALRAALPAGMKAVGGVGNGLLEVAQDFVPFEHLAYLRVDDPEAYALLFQRIGEALHVIWDRVLSEYRDTFAVCRIGDDLGFRSSTLIAPEDIRAYIVPRYKEIVALIHRHGAPFLLHSCGRIYDVMDDLIDVVGIDAKHSNEDAIDPFRVWLEKYGGRIGNFGGIEMNVLCLNTETEIKAYVREVLEYAADYDGVAIGSGNQISSYVPPAGFIAMTEAVREFRGE